MTPQLSGRSETWQQALAQAITRPRELLQALDLDESLLAGAHAGAELFPLRVPRGFVSRMRKGDPHDPLLRQVLPLTAEARPQPGFSDDPVGDLASMTVPGLLHKYHGRALLITTGACAVHCRYCFRRHFPYGEAHTGGHHLASALDCIRADPGLHEIILSGGDPLSLSDERLSRITDELAGIGHVTRLRLHTRTAIVLPERITGAMVDWVSAWPGQVVIVVHANHANEINAPVIAALRQLREAGALLLNQAVILRGVNDSATALCDLSERLFAAGVLPYYLHLLDRVAGAAHFEVDRQEAAQLLAEAARRLPGYLLPRLACEEAGAASKTLIAPTDASDHRPVVENQRQIG